MLNLMVVVFHILRKTDFNLRKYASKAPYVAISSTVETELKVRQSALDVHIGCTPFVKD